MEEEDGENRGFFVFRIITLAMYFRQFVSVIGYIVTRIYMMVRYLKRLKSSRLGCVQAFPMSGGLGMSAPSLIESLPTL